MGLMGAFCSTFHPAANTLISLGVREKGTAFGINGIAGSVGVAVVPVLSAWIGTSLGWRAPHVFFGLIGMGLGFFSLTLPRHPTIQKKHSSQAALQTAPEKRNTLLSLWFFFLSATALGLSYKGIMTFLPTYMGQNIHLGILKMDVVATGGAFATLALISGYLADLYGLQIVFYAMGFCFLVSAVFVLGMVLLGSKR